MKIVLGSASPRRRQILETLGFQPLVVAPDVDEAVLGAESPLAYVERVSRAKFEAVRAQATTLALQQPEVASGPVVVADTIVEVDECILGKPKDDAEAIGVLTRLSGRDHWVHTRFIVGKPGRNAHEETVSTRVTFRVLAETEIAAYVATGEARDKAGSYGIQGFASAFVSRIDGSYSNVVGLPACEVYVALTRT